MITALVPKQSQPELTSDATTTFVELMHLVEDAQNKKLISAFYAINTSLQREIAVHNKDGIYKWNFNKHGIKDAFDFISSLYTETFVIENEDSLKKVQVNSPDTKITLSNGTDVKCSGSVDSSNEDGFAIGVIVNHPHVRYFGISILKGATVTQKRGEV